MSLPERVGTLCVYEVAAVSEEAAAELQEGAAALGFVFTVCLLVLL